MIIIINMKKLKIDKRRKPKFCKWCNSSKPFLIYRKSYIESGKIVEDLYICSICDKGTFSKKYERVKQ